MIVCLSPAKKLDYESPISVPAATQPVFMERSAELIKRLRELPRSEVKSLMGLSDKLTDLNVERYATWTLPFDQDNARPCLLAFAGDVFRGMDPWSLDHNDLDFAQEHLRILSGLHGVLRPLDLVQPYRLEMGTKLAIGEHKSLYSYWGDSIAKVLRRSMDDLGTDTLINLASQEYFGAVKKDHIQGQIIQPVFKDRKNGKYSIFFIYAKRARGMMSRYIIENRLTDPNEIKSFDVAGYAFNPALSDETEWVFTREKRPAKA